MERFRTCDECSRHVRASEAKCPFCGHALAAAPLMPVPRAPAQLSRAQRIALVAAVAGGIAACGDDSPPPSSGPHAGASAGTSAGGTSGAAAGSGASTAAGRGAAGQVAVPVYGAPVTPPVGAAGSSGAAGKGGAGGAGGSAGAAGAAGAAGKAGASGSGVAGRGMVQPLYGASPVPVDPPKK